MAKYFDTIRDIEKDYKIYKGIDKDGSPEDYYELTVNNLDLTEEEEELLEQWIKEKKLEQKILWELGNIRKGARFYRVLEILQDWKKRLGYIPKFEVIRTSDYWYSSRRNRNKDFDYTIVGSDAGQYRYYYWLVIDPSQPDETQNPSK